MTLLNGKCWARLHVVKKRIELLHDMMEGRDYGQLKDLLLDSQDGDNRMHVRNLRETAED